VSYNLSTSILRCDFILQNKTRVIRNGVDLKTFRPKERIQSKVDLSAYQLKSS